MIVDSLGANSLCEFDWMRPQAAVLIAFTAVKGVFHFPFSIIHCQLKGLFLTLCLFMITFACIFNPYRGDTGCFLVGCEMRRTWAAPVNTKDVWP